ncbi:hypothetical protein [Thalassoglobus polymorphus]|uniref:hypothetical protein n=1 Tax=Thalassoglobus polymorphus TaxID=2527994 RepID=UPI0018D23A80|nr:hypothetical protein [Thalassoglobus polymorphus]
MTKSLSFWDGKVRFPDQFPNCRKAANLFGNELVDISCCTLFFDVAVSQNRFTLDKRF